MAEEFQNLYIDYLYGNEKYLLLGDGPLPFALRHYVALMGLHQFRPYASLSQSGLVKYNMDQFLYRGGNPLWLTTLESVPPKLQSLRGINESLAREPWLLTPPCISKLLHNPGIWSLTELMQAILILSNLHSLSRFFAVSDRLLEEELTDPAFDPPLEGAGSSDLDTKSTTTDDMVNYGINFALFESRHQEVTDGSIGAPVLSDFEVLGFLEDTSMTYHEFRERLTGHKGSFFHIHDYSWQDHGYSLANRLYMEFGISLDEEFSVIQNESTALYAMDDTDDAASYTWAVWNYVFLLFGIQLEDYHRTEVNQRLSSEVKAFIKLIACFPERLHHQTFSKFNKSLKLSDRRHLNVLVQEAQFQVSLMYSLRALSKLA